MKIVSRFICCIFLIISCSSNSLLFSQEKRLSFNIGAAPSLDAMHPGVNFKITRKVDVGLSIGSIPVRYDFNNHLNIGFETKYKFGESKTIKYRVLIEDRLKRVKAKTWYGGLRVNLVTDKESKITTKKYIYITPAIGRHFNFNQFMGVNIDFGLSFTANQVTTYSGNNICDICYLQEHPQYPLLPTLRVQFFIKI